MKPESGEATFVGRQPLFRGLVLVVAAATVGLVAVGLVGGQHSAEAQQTASATRSFSPSEVEAGGQLVVTIAVDAYGGIGQLRETFPADFTFESSPEGTRFDQTLTFNLVGDTSVSYTLRAPTTTGIKSGFSGILAPAVGAGVTVDGPSSVTVSSPPRSPPQGSVDLPGPGEVPDLPGVAALPDLPGPREVPGIPDLPGPRAKPEIPDLPGPGAKPEIPDLPGPRAKPEIPDPPGPRAMPDLPGPRAMPDLPGPRAMPDLPGPRAIPEIPDPPGPRAIPDLPGPRAIPEILVPASWGS